MSGPDAHPTPAWPESWGDQAESRVGFFTDTSVCIGCKACEVACKEWNEVPEENHGLSGNSYDNSLDLGANRWRHVAFIEQRVEVGGVTNRRPTRGSRRRRASSSSSRACRCTPTTTDSGG